MSADQHSIREFGRRTYPGPWGATEPVAGRNPPRLGEDLGVGHGTALPIRLTHTGLEGRPDRFMCR